MKLPPLQGALWLCCTVVPVLWGPHFQYNLQKKRLQDDSFPENDWTNQSPFRRERRGQNQHKWCAHHYLQCAGWIINSLSGCFYCIHTLWKQYWTVELRWTVRFLTEPRPSSYRASKYQKLGHLSTKTGFSPSVLRVGLQSDQQLFHTARPNCRRELSSCSDGASAPPKTARKRRWIPEPGRRAKSAGRSQQLLLLASSSAGLLCSSSSRWEIPSTTRSMAAPTAPLWTEDLIRPGYLRRRPPRWRASRWSNPSPRSTCWCWELSWQRAWRACSTTTHRILRINTMELWMFWVTEGTFYAEICFHMIKINV